MDHRLHDFVELGKRIFEAADWPPDHFVNQLDDLRRSTGSDIDEGDAFVVAARAVLGRLAKSAEAACDLPGWKAWFPDGHVAVKLPNGEILVGIRPKKFVEMLRNNAMIGGDWLPRNERAASGALLRTVPILSDIGIGVTKQEPSKGNAFWQFRLSSDYRLDGQ